MGDGFDARSTARAAMEALRQGNHAAARARLSEIVDAGQADASVFVGLAVANGALGDDVAKLSALDQALALEPGHTRALLLKGGHLLKGGDDRQALAHFNAALRTAGPPELMSAELKRDLAQVKMQLDANAAQRAAHLRERLAERGFGEDASRRRFLDSIDLLAGRKRLYVQEPRYYYFPGLPQVQFYEREAFPWLKEIEARTADIRAELLEVLRDEGAFKPYVEKAAQARHESEYSGMLGNPHWGAFFLWKDGALVEENAARCPNTLSALEAAPLSRTPGRMPSVLFSKLDPKTRIPPHHGFLNPRLIVHLPLIVPPGCGFRVGNETRAWVEGEALVFDDTFEHEAWNDSDQIRVVLLFEIWRPELSDEERAMVTALFEILDTESGPDSVEWRD
jgi:aspartyl/asparaginyl beta-hydroxylase (cupin superfamily)